MEGWKDSVRSLYSIERTAVSGKTDYLVAGFEMEDGRPITEGAQYKAAIKKKVKIISDYDLMKMIENSILKENCTCLLKL